MFAYMMLTWILMSVFFGISVDRNKTKNCNFHPWKRIWRCTVSYFTNFSKMISQGLLFDFLILGKIISLWKRKKIIENHIKGSTKIHIITQLLNLNMWVFHDFWIFDYSFKCISDSGELIVNNLRNKFLL